MDRANKQPSSNRTESGKLRNKMETLGRKIAASTVIALGVATLSACADSEAAPAPTSSQAVETTTPTAPTTETTAPEQTTTPEVETEDTRPGAENTPVVTPENEAEIIESLRISADLTPEEVAEKIMENDSRWAMAGAVPDTWVNQDFSITIEEYTEQISLANQYAFRAGIFGPNSEAEQNPEVEEYVRGMTSLNQGNLYRYLVSYGDEENPNSNSENVETFRQYMEVVGVEVISQTDEELVIEITSMDHNNGAQTFFTDSAQYDGVISTHRFTLAVQGDYYVITASVNA